MKESVTRQDCGLQADDGYLYPLERAFFYVHKPPTLIVFDEIASVEFMRQGGGLIAASAKTFDLNVRQRNDQVRSLAMDSSAVWQTSPFELAACFELFSGTKACLIVCPCNAC